MLVDDIGESESQQAGPGFQVKTRIGVFLRDELMLELSQTKTLVTHARTEDARFLSYHIHTYQDDQRRSQSGQRINGIVSLMVPLDVIHEKSQSYRKHGKPVHRAEWTNDGVYDIIVRYQQKYRGLVEYYRLAHNLYQLDRLKYVMEASLTKTLARKLRISVRQVYQRFGTVLLTENGPYKGLQFKIKREEQRPLVATWGGISLKRDLGAELNDAPLSLPVNYRTELEQRHTAEYAYQSALADWQALTAEPEQLPDWPQFHANALQDALRKVNTRRKETLAAMTQADWRSAVYREMQADLWYAEPEETERPVNHAALDLLDDLSSLRRNGSSAVPKVISAASGAV